MIQYDSYFSNGLKPPTSDGLIDCFWIFQKFLEQTCILDFYLARCLVPQLDQWTKTWLRIWQSYHHFHVPIRTRSSSWYTAFSVDSAYVIETPEKLHISIFRRLKIWMTISEPKLKGYPSPLMLLKSHPCFCFIIFLEVPKSWFTCLKSRDNTLAEEDWFLDLGKCSHFALSEFVALHTKKKTVVFFVGNDDLKHWNSYFLFAPSKPWQSLMGCDRGKGANFIQLIVEHFKSSSYSWCIELGQHTTPSN